MSRGSGHGLPRGEDGAGRREDLRFLTGRGRYLDDLEAAGALHACIVRSPHAHARIVSVDGAPALEAGAAAVLTGADWLADGMGPVPSRTAARNSDGTPVPVPERPALATGAVRFVGDAVALVLAESPGAARDAAEAVQVDYEPLPAVTDAVEAMRPGAPRVWPDLPDNACVRFEAGDAGAVESALAGSAHVVRLDVVNQRVTGVPIEPRGAIGFHDADDGTYLLRCSTQNVHANRDQLAESVFGIPAGDIRQVAPDVGGGFGVKNALYPEHALVLWAARRTGRPVRWVNDRSESFLSDSHGRDQRSRVELGVDGEGRITALRVDTVGNTGAYVLTVGPFTSTGGTVRTQGGPYRVPAVHFRASAVFTHTTPTDPYRGAGRPEATMQIERALDVAARELGMDPAEIRRRNLLAPRDLPRTTGVGTEIECGDFPALLERTLAAADWDGIEDRRREAAARGRLRGIGLCCYLACTGGGPREHARLQFDADGGVLLAVGTQSNGTGHETTLSRLVAGRLGIPEARVRFVQADTRATPVGGGHGGSRALETGGAAVVGALEAALERGRRVAARLMQAAEPEVVYQDGTFSVAGSRRSVSLGEVAAAAVGPGGMNEGMDGGYTYDREGVTFPNGCHVAEVEVDPDTGAVALVGYHVTDDFGPILNPRTARGQVHGATAQGVGQALMEAVVHDPETGQPLTGSLVDYALPRAADLPPLDVSFHETVPSARNPLGVKGCGEAGCCGAPPAVVNAVVDALGPSGIKHLDMPLTPERVWRALHRAGPGAS